MASTLSTAQILSIPSHFTCQVLPSLRAFKSPTFTYYHQTKNITLKAKSPDDVEPIPAATFPSLASADEIELEAKWLGGIIAAWLDDEWTPLEVHRQLGTAVEEIYIQLRQQGAEDEVGDIVLGIAQGLISFNFRECFVGPFDVANKAVEVLMIKKSGCDVCCVSEADRAAIDRYEEIVLAEQQQKQ